MEPSANDAAPPRGVAGVEVTAVLVDDDGARPLVTRTDPEGRYTLLADWKREQPDSDTPSGEDEIAIELRFSGVQRGDRRLVFEPLAYPARSWTRPNYVPDAIASPPGAAVRRPRRGARCARR